MENIVINSSFKLKRGTAAQWTQLNPILQLGEPGFEKDTFKLKIGDGVRNWSALPYIGSLGGGGGTSNYEDLVNKPQINGTVLSGNTILQEDKTYVHNQLAALDVWSISHNLDKYPSVFVVDSGDNVVVGEIEYKSTNELLVKFSSAFSGKAYLN